MTLMETIKAGRRAKRLLERELVKRFDVTVPGYEVLKALANNGPLNMCRLAEETDMNPGGLTGIVDRLKVAGRITRDRPEENRRTVIVKLAEPEWFAEVDRFVQETTENGLAA